MKGWRWPESTRSQPDSGMRAERELLNSEVMKEGVWQILIGSENNEWVELKDS